MSTPVFSSLSIVVEANQSINWRIRQTICTYSMIALSWFIPSQASMCQLWLFEYAFSRGFSHFLLYSLMWVCKSASRNPFTLRVFSSVLGLFSNLRPIRPDDLDFYFWSNLVTPFNCLVITFTCPMHFFISFSLNPPLVMFTPKYLYDLVKLTVPRSSTKSRSFAPTTLVIGKV